MSEAEASIGGGVLPPQLRKALESLFNQIASSAPDRWEQVASLASRQAQCPCSPQQARQYHAVLAAQIEGQLSEFRVASAPGSLVGTPVDLRKKRSHRFTHTPASPSSPSRMRSRGVKQERAIVKQDELSLLAIEPPLTPTPTPPPGAVAPRQQQHQQQHQQRGSATDARAAAPATGRPRAASAPPTPKNARGGRGGRRPQVTNAGAWTPAEHEYFLRGLATFGRSQWRKISDHFVPSRNPQQIASHAQKYFLRQAQREGKGGPTSTGAAATGTTEPRKIRRVSIHDFNLKSLVELGEIAEQDAANVSETATAPPRDPQAGHGRRPSLLAGSDCSDGAASPDAPASRAKVMSPKTPSPKKSRTTSRSGLLTSPQGASASPRLVSARARRRSTYIPELERLGFKDFDIPGIPVEPEPAMPVPAMMLSDGPGAALGTTAAPAPLVPAPYQALCPQPAPAIVPMTPSPTSSSAPSSQVSTGLLSADLQLDDLRLPEPRDAACTADLTMMDLPADALAQLLDQSGFGGYGIAPGDSSMFPAFPGEQTQSAPEFNATSPSSAVPESLTSDVSPHAEVPAFTDDAGDAIGCDGASACDGAAAASSSAAAAAALTNECSLKTATAQLFDLFPQVSMLLEQTDVLGI